MALTVDQIESGGALLENLAQHVRRARRRWMLRRSLTGLTIGIACVSVILAVAVGLSAFEVLPVEGRAVWWAAVVLVAVATSVAVSHSWAATPDEPAMVRFIDDGVKLESQLVTAFELRRQPPTNPVARVLHLALLRDLERSGLVVNVDRLLPLRFLPVHAAAFAIVIGSVVAANVVDYWRPTGNPGGSAEATAPSTWGAAELGRMATELELLAGALEEEADSTGDEYTRALAEYARALAREMREPGSDSASAQAGVSNLLSHLERALGSRFTTGASDATAAESGAAAEAASFSGEPDVEMMGLSVPMSPASSSLASDVQEIRERLEMFQSRRVQNPYFGGSFEVSSVNSPVDVKEAGLIGEQGSQEGGAPAGAAQRSTDAAGDAAGGGSQELDVGQRAAAGSFLEGEDFALPQAASGSGARVQASTEPGEESSSSATIISRNGGNAEAGVAGLAGTVEAIDSIRRDGGGWRREPLGPHARLVALRLFEPENLETTE